MNVVVNGEPQSVRSCVLDKIVEELGVDGGAVATAVNGRFVPRLDRINKAIHTGDTIEIVSPRQGG